MVWSYRILFTTTSISCLLPILDIVSFSKDNSQAISLATYAILFFGQTAYSLILSANLFFILLDCKVSSVLVDQLINLQKENLLTLDKYNAVRTEIDNRVKNTFWLNFMLVVVCILNGLAALALLVFSTLTIEFKIVALLLLIKELPFLIIVFYKSAGVNDKSDRLITMLATDAWDIEQITQCNHRTILYINAEGRRISFPLAGLRMNYKDVHRQFAGWLLAAIFAVIKAAIGDIS